MTNAARRSFLLRAGGAGLGMAFSGSLTSVLTSASPAGAVGAGSFPPGFGALHPDRDGLLDLPRGFHYRAFSRQDVDQLDNGDPVPAAHDGMAAFPGALGRTVLVRNHEIDFDDVEEDGLAPVPHVAGSDYDPNGTGGTTTLVVGPGRRLESHRVSLSGTVNNCAGGPAPWGTWLTCEETDEVRDGVPHGYVFEVDPDAGGDPRPIEALGRFEHEAVSFDPGSGEAYLTEDADGPFGLFYRFRPAQPLGGRGSLHAGGVLAAMVVPDLAGTDLSAVGQAGTVLTDITWTDIAQPDVPEGEAIRRLVDATPIPKCEGTWERDGCVWFVSSRGDGPDAEEEEDRSAGVHGGQIWCYDPAAATLRLVVQFEPSSPFEGPDNITVSPHGFAVMCTDGEDDQQFVAGVTPDGETFPIAFNQLSNEEFAGACFSPDGQVLYVNIQDPGHTFAIWGPWSLGRSGVLGGRLRSS